MKDLIIIGAGASGMLASILASEKCDCLIIEKNERAGKKLLTTGNGRCNYTNLDLNISHFHSEDKNLKEFMKDINLDEILNLFEKLGIMPYSIENGRVYPNSLQSASMLDALRFAIDEKNIETKFSENVKAIEKNKHYYTVITDKGKYDAKNILIATGGMAMPKSGSDGAGYKFFQKFGHIKNDIMPSLVQLKSDFPYLKEMDGVKTESCLSLLIDGKIIQSEFGDVLFTSYGISGPSVLDMSRIAIRELKNKSEVEVSVKLVEISKDKLKERFEYLRKRQISTAMIGLIHKKLILPMLKVLNIDKDKLAQDIAENEIKKLSNLLGDFRLKITGDTGFGNAQTTQGGLKLSDFNPKTLESKLSPGLYATGEILDVDGDCGGYNLSWAWYSAIKVAKAIKEKK